MLEYRTEGFKNFGVQYSPFIDSRIAVVAGANFGLVGNGRLYILNLTANGIETDKWYDTQDCLYDLAWSEAHSNQLVTASGDGSVKLFDTAFADFPVQQWTEHSREVFSVSWNLVTKDTFCSASWDGTIKVYDPSRPTSLLTLPTLSCTYSAAFSPHSPSLLSAVSSDSTFRLFDLRTPASASNHLVQSIALHRSSPTGPTRSNSSIPTHPPSEALTHDWNKYRPTNIAAAGVDRLIRTFDIRMADQGPLAVMAGHGYAIRKIAWSPHLPDVLLSASYDMTVRVWSDGLEEGRSEQTLGTVEPRELGRMGRHTEFVAGLDWCLFGAEGWCASAGWDERLLVWDVKGIMG